LIGPIRESEDALWNEPALFDVKVRSSAALARKLQYVSDPSNNKSKGKGDIARMDIFGQKILEFL
jgi:hypothetical protein